MNMFKLITKPKNVSDARREQRVAQLLLWFAAFLALVGVTVGRSSLMEFLVVAAMIVTVGMMMSREARDFLERH